MTDTTLEPTSPAPQSETREPQTGLLRRLGLFDILAMTVLAVSLVFTGWLPFSTLAGRFPTASLNILIGIGLVFVLIHTFTFSAMGAVFPYAGADYVAATRGLSPLLGFVASWIQTLFLAILAGGLAVWAAQTALPALIQSLGFLLNNTGFIQAATSITEPATTALISAAILVLGFALATADLSTNRRIWMAIFILTVIAWGIICGQLYLSDSAAVQSSWNASMGTGAYQQVLLDAKSLALPSEQSLPTAIGVGLVLSLGIFFGAFLPAQMAGEAKKPGVTLPLGSMLAVIIIAGLVLLSIYLTQRVFTPLWLTSESYIFQNYRFGTQLPWLTFYAGIATRGVVWNTFTSLTWLIGIIAMIQVLLMTASRSVFAWAKDGLMPSYLSMYQKRARVPLVALLFVGIVALLTSLVVLLGGQWVPDRLMVWVVAAAQLIPVLALIIVPFKKQSWTSRAGGIYGFRLLGIPVISLFAAISFVFLLAVIAGPFVFTLVKQHLLMSQVYLLAALAGTGVIWYFIRLIYMRRKGGSIPANCRELPPTE